MRAPVNTPAAGLLGALGLTVIAVLLLRGDLLLADAASRAVVLLVAVVVGERVLLPAARLLVGRPPEREPESADGPARGHGQRENRS